MNTNKRPYSKMIKLENTFKLTFTALLLFNFNAVSAEVDPQIIACNSALNNQQYEAAITKANAAIKQKELASQGSMCKGRALLAMGKQEEAKAEFILADKKASNDFDKTVANLLLGNYEKEQQHYQEAIKLYEKSLGYAQKDDNRNFTRVSYNLLGDTYGLLVEYPTSLKYLEEGEKLAMNDNERADSYERIAANYQAQYQFDKAIEYQIKGVAMQQKAGTLDQYAEANLTLGHLYTQSKDFAKAEATLDKLLKFSQDNGGAYYEAKTNIYLAQAKLAQGDNAAANDLFGQAKTIAEKIQATDLIALIDATQKSSN
jgi:tetratricopeptide (TPR) repeat protein